MNRSDNRSAVVVPCYNEAERLDTEALLALRSIVSTVIFVNDGSSDNTAEILGDLVDQHPNSIRLINFDVNAGKGEAVRQGMQAAIETDASLVGYLDADLATPTSEFERLVETISTSPQFDAVIGSRVALSGHQISRSRVRHYVGRIYATAASLLLGQVVYDTQCGAKIFRVSPMLVRALDREFVDRWSFDVELLGRLFKSGAEVLEVPLDEWAEVPGSKLGLNQSFRSAISLGRVHQQLRNWNPAER